MERQRLLLTQVFLCLVAGFSTAACGKSKRGGGNDTCPAGTDCSEPTPTPMNATLTCVDADGDGYGVDCALGFDCNDNDPVQIGREICDDGKDNDCNDLIDNGCVSACAGVLNCKNSPVGGPNGQPFDPGSLSGGVIVGPDGALILSSTASTNSYIWIANTQQGTISKINAKVTNPNTGLYLEEARYAVGDRAPYGCYGSAPDYSGLCAYFNGVDPSRTSVNGDGDIFVGNRNGGAITKITGDNSRCGDNNGDTLINNTSRNPIVVGGVPTYSTTAPLIPGAWTGGKSPDDCVRWRTQLTPTLDLSVTLNGTPSRVRAVAAQDVEDVTGSKRHYVWIGDTDVAITGQPQGVIWKLDGDTGALLLTTRIANCRPYGFALDGNKNLWVSCRQSSRIARLDTMRCTTTDNCKEDPMVAPTCAGEGVVDGVNCDLAVKQTITGTAPGVVIASALYGITVDAKQRVWFATDSQGIIRYTPTAAAGSRMARASENGTLMAGVTRGITVFGQTTVFAYGARGNGNVVLVNGETMGWTELSLGTGRSSYGMAADLDGKIWSVGSNNTNVAVVVRNSNTLSDVTVTTGFTGVVGPYTYSDMTGSQLRYATNPSGTFRHLVDGCMGRPTSWKNLVWDADVPAGTRLRWSVTTGNTIEELDAATAVAIAEVPSDVAPVDIGAKLQEANVTSGALLEVEVELISDSSDPTQPQTPKLRSLDVGYVCNGGVLI